MSHNVTSTGCPVVYKPVDPVPFYQDGQLNFKAHQVGWIISGFFALVATSCTVYLVDRHLVFYTCPQQQRHIVRMLFMVPIYAIVSWLSYFYYNHAIYYETVRDCYESVVITSFFYLLLQYIGDTPVEQDEVFRNVKLKKWFFPLGWWKYRPSGLHFLWLMKISILQYAIVRPVCTLAAVALEYFDYYCLASWSPKFGHIWISLAISISVTVAMYCVVQFYLPVQKELKPYSPVLKFLSVKTIVFLVFWQSTFLSVLAYFNVIKGTEYMTVEEVQVGINALLETFEMFVFGFVHLVAFTHKIYRPADRTRRTKRWAAFKDVIDFRDWWYGMKDSSRYVLAKSRGRDFTYVDEVRRQKYDHLEKAMGRDRWAELHRERDRAKAATKSFFKGGGRPDDDAGDIDVEGTAAGSGADSEKTTNARDSRSRALNNAAAPAHTSDDQVLSAPRGNRALDPQYNPEAEDFGDLDDDEDRDERFVGDQDEEFRRESRGLMFAVTKPTLPRIPALRYDDSPSPSLAPERKTFRPEQRRYKLTATNDVELEEDVDEKTYDEPSALRQDARSRRQGSGSIGAWWRGVMARLSGSEVVDPVMEHDEDDLRNAQPDAYTDRSAPAKKLSTSSNESAQVSVLRGADSPLDRFIATHQSPEGTGEHSPVNNADDLPAQAATRDGGPAIRPPILQTVSTGRIDAGALGVSSAFSRVSSMRTTAARTEATHADSEVSARLIAGVAEHAEGMPIRNPETDGLQSHVASVDGHAGASAPPASSTPLAAVPQKTPTGDFQQRSFTAGERPPSPSASSAAGVPRGTLFSDPATERYAARAATRPPVQINSGSAPKSTKLPVSHTSGLTRESRSMVRTKQPSVVTQPRVVESRDKHVQLDPRTSGSQQASQAQVQASVSGSGDVLSPQDFSSHKTKLDNVRPLSPRQMASTALQTPMLAPRPVRPSPERLDAPSTSAATAQKRISTGSSTSFIAPPNSIFSSSPVQTEQVLAETKAASASGSLYNPDQVMQRASLVAVSASARSAAQAPSDASLMATTTPQSMVERLSYTPVNTQTSGSSPGPSERRSSAQNLEKQSARSRSSQPPPLAAPHRAPSANSGRTLQSGSSVGVPPSQIATGPKGKRISLVLPSALSPEGLPEPAHAIAAPSITPSVASGPVRERRLTFQETSRPDARSSVAAAPRSRSDSVPKHKSMEEREREYLGLPAKPGSKGTVTNGALSQAQIRRAEEQAAIARADAERVQAFEAWRAEKERSERAARDAELAAHAQAQAARIKHHNAQGEKGADRVLTAPKVGPSQIPAIQPAAVSKRTWFGTKTKQPAPYTPLPAPSRLGVDIGEDADAFTAAATAAKAPTVLAEAPKVEEANRAGVGASRMAAHPVHGSRQQAGILQPGQTISPYAYQQARGPAPRHVVAQPYPNAPGMPGSGFVSTAQPYRTRHDPHSAIRRAEEEQWRRQQMQETILAQRRARRHSIESAGYEQRGQETQPWPLYVRQETGPARERRHSIDPAERAAVGGSRGGQPRPIPTRPLAHGAQSHPYDLQGSNFPQPYSIENSRSRRDMAGETYHYGTASRPDTSRQYSLPDASRGAGPAGATASRMHVHGAWSGPTQHRQAPHGYAAAAPQGQPRRVSRGYELPEGFSVDYVD